MTLQTHLRFPKQLIWQLLRFSASRGILAPSTSSFQQRKFVHGKLEHAKSPVFRAKNPFRKFSSNSVQTEYRLELSGLQLESFHARDIYKEAVNSVEPRRMVEKVLQFDKESSTLTVKDKSYHLDGNVYVVGFGKAVLGMARATEDILGEHVVRGILSIPKGQREILKEKEKGDLLLLPESKIEVYEGGTSYLPDYEAHKAALAIEKLLSCRKETDLVIVLVSGGGSPLLPCPQEPITLGELIDMTKILAHNGASVKDINVIRKNVERLKGGKMVETAQPAQVVSLIISDVIGDPISLIASGPTVHDEVTAHQCCEMLNRVGVYDKMPQSIISHLQWQMADEALRVRYKQSIGSGNINSPRKDTKNLHKEHVQNVLVGSNSIACQAAFSRAIELGHLPYILSTTMEGEARKIGATLGKLGMFMLMCFDRKLSSQLNVLQLELDIVKDGITKQQINEIMTLVDRASNMGKNAVIISGGESVVNVKGCGTGGRNLELALGASLQLQQLFGLSKPRPNPDITLLSADTDGEDGPNCAAAGAVINENFEIEACLSGHNCEDYLNNNDTYTLFSNVKGGSHLVVTRMTGTNVMDIQILIVRNPISGIINSS